MRAFTPQKARGPVVAFVAESWVTPLHHRCATALTRRSGGRVLASMVGWLQVLGESLPVAGTTI